MADRVPVGPGLHRRGARPRSTWHDAPRPAADRGRRDRGRRSSRSIARAARVARPAEIVSRGFVPDAAEDEALLREAARTWSRGRWPRPRARSGPTRACSRRKIQAGAEALPAAAARSAAAHHSRHRGACRLRRAYGRAPCLDPRLRKKRWFDEVAGAPARSCSPRSRSAPSSATTARPDVVPVAAAGVHAAANWIGRVGAHARRGRSSSSSAPRAFLVPVVLRGDGLESLPRARASRRRTAGCSGYSLLVGIARDAARPDLRVRSRYGGESVPARAATSARGVAGALTRADRTRSGAILVAVDPPRGHDRADDAVLVRAGRGRVGDGLGGRSSARWRALDGAAARTRRRDARQKRASREAREVARPRRHAAETPRPAADGRAAARSRSPTTPTRPPPREPKVATRRARCRGRPPRRRPRSSSRCRWTPGRRVRAAAARAAERAEAAGGRETRRSSSRARSCSTRQVPRVRRRRARSSRSTPGRSSRRSSSSPKPACKYSKITGLVDDLCLGLKAESIRIDRIPGRSTVGIEVPNQHQEIDLPARAARLREVPRVALEADARAGQGHQRRRLHRRARPDAAPADRRRDGRRQVGRPERDDHEHPLQGDARPTSASS